MKGKEPRLLPNIMDAIVNLKEKNGSSQKDIAEHVGDILKKGKDQCRNLSTQIKRAIEHGVKIGLVKRSRGKYLLGLDKRNYDIFKKFRNLPVEPCSSAKRGRKGRRRGRRRSGRRRRSRRSRRRHGRRHALFVDDASEDAGSTSDGGLDGTEEPGDKTGRRRRRRRRRRSRRSRRRGSRRGRKRRLSSENVDSADLVSKSSSENLKQDKTRQDSPQQEYQTRPVSRTVSRHNLHQDPQNSAIEHESADCGNPECLCNIQTESSQRRTPQDNYFNSYLN